VSNRRVFSFFLNVAKFSVSLISGGRLFRYQGQHLRLIARIKNRMRL